jgi:MFS family permease
LCPCPHHAQIFATLVFLGSLVVFLAVSLDCDHNARFYLMMLGMAIFGIGAESLNVAQKAMLSSWFADATEFPQLAFAVSCTLTFGYSGAIACRWVAPQMADPSGGAREGAPSGACPQIDTLNATQLPASDNGTLGPNVTHDGGGGGGGADALECADHAAVSRAFALAAGVCAFSTLCVIGAAALHKRDARLVHEGRRRSARRDSSLGAPLMQQKEPAEVRMGTIQSAGSAESSSDGGSLYGGLEAARGGDYGGDYGGGGGASRVSLSVRVQRAVETSSSGLGKLPRCFWWLGGMLAVASGCFNSFEVYGADVLQEHWHFDLQRAGLVSSVFPACGIVFLPIAGALYDQRGGRILGAAIGCAIFTCGWFAITVGSSSHSGGELEHPWAGTPWAATVAVALGAAMFFGGLWPCVPMMVPAANVGVAFGAMTAIQNLALAVGQLAAGALRDHTGNFKATGIFLAGLGAAAMVLGRRAMLSWRAMQEERVANDKAEVGRDFGGAGSVLHASDISISRETIFFDE